MNTTIRKIRASIKLNSRKLQICLKSKHPAFSSYSVVSACYNVLPYIDQFVGSIIWQSIGFKQNIELILVDDGSTDGTSERIDYWARRYPHQIIALHQSNAGPAAARNRGLAIAKKEWITFTDPDDFLDLYALEKVDTFLCAHQGESVCMVALNVKFFIEKDHIFQDTHPLSYKFKRHETIRKVNELGNFIQLSAASSILRRELLIKNNLTFPEKCRPSFEDAALLNHYLLHSFSNSVAFLRHACYYYRKRSDHTSIIDNAVSDKRRYCSVFKYGHLPLLAQAALLNNGKIPDFIQITILYDCGWLVRRAINQDDKLSLLNADELNHYQANLDKVLRHCSPDIVWNSDVKSLPSHYHKVGILGCFMRTEPPFQEIIIDKYDPRDDSVFLRHYTCFDHDEKFFINSKSVQPSFKKVIHDTFGQRTFIEHHVFWLSLRGLHDDAKLSATILGRPALLKHGKSIFENYSVGRIRSLAPARSVNEKSPHAHCWLISDRDTQADDNGEHLYRWVQHNHPEIPIRFLLNKSSHDWSRLKAEGFHLINYGSREHRKALAQCDMIISSHADDYIVNYFNDPQATVNKHAFVFLQHGVLTTDLSRWLNTKDIQLFITSASKEYAAVANDGNRYHFTSKEVKCTGLPRHDELLRKNNPQKIILIMPTWRASLARECIRHSSARKDNPDFMDSTYAKTYLHFLHSEKLRAIANRFGYRIIFFPHANIQQYLKFFDLPAHIEVATHKTTGIQDLLGSGSLLVTDYSSVASEFAYLQKPVIYYQFDYSDIFEYRTHTCSKGFFDWRTDGFGEVVSTQEELLLAIEHALQNGCQIQEPYAKRAREFFAYRDGKCCERVFLEILKLR